MNKSTLLHNSVQLTSALICHCELTNVCPAGGDVKPALAVIQAGAIMGSAVGLM